jgi:hypothetical protein
MVSRTQWDADAQVLAQDGCTPKLGHPPLARKRMLIAGCLGHGDRGTEDEHRCDRRT